jgi:nicotinate-nucleotide pyrophosphorylase (carboxylating)
MDYASFWESAELEQLIKTALHEDIGSGDHSSLAVIPKDTEGKAKMLLKENAVVAGIKIAEIIMRMYDSTVKVNSFVKDGQYCSKGTVLMEFSGSAISILSTERLILNFCQRLSGIATISNQYAAIAKPFQVKILDTRKTTPGLRILEKWAVAIGGCDNHRIGLYDMIMLKDNHVDFSGGIKHAIKAVQAYQSAKKLNLKVEIETRNLNEVGEVCQIGGVDRIMLDNFSPQDLNQAVRIINKRFETEASGGITLENLVDYAKSGVDFISVGALTHSAKSIDINLKTVL